jgi:hypothetical protein
MTEIAPDFYGFLHQQAERLRDDCRTVNSESQLEAVRRKWLGPPNGILENLKSDPYYAAANENERKVFDDYILELINLETKYCRRFWDLWET